MRIAFRLLFLLSTLIHYSAGQSSCDLHDGYREIPGDGLNSTSEITDTTEFQYNLGIVLNQSINIETYGWFGYYYGEEPNEAYSQGRCIGYVGNDICLGCIKDAISKLKQDCVGTTNSAIILFSDHCIVQYSNHNMCGMVTMSDNMIVTTNTTIDVSSDADAFNAARTKLFNELASIAEARPGGYKMSAAGKWYDESSKQTIYGVAQCSPDLVSDECNACLAIVGQNLEEHFNSKVGGSIVGPSCNFQYDVKSFIDTSIVVFDNLSPPSPPPPASPPQHAAPALQSQQVIIYISTGMT